MVAWSTGVAYISASLFYQIATYEAHPGSALSWIIGLSVGLMLIVGGLRHWSLRLQHTGDRAAV